MAPVAQERKRQSIQRNEDIHAKTDVSFEGTPKRALDSDDEDDEDNVHVRSRDKRVRRGESPYDEIKRGNGDRNRGNSRKNAQVQHNHYGSSEDEESNMEENNEGSEGAFFQTGAIRRVKLTNFVTYSSVEFFPGPSLNMVIGPNGTGKSTLVCAICIGLGYDPKFLGRAKDVSEFVKHGAQEAFIEIELEGATAKKGSSSGTRGGDSKNPVVRCNIKRDGNRSMYSINKKPISGRQLKERMGKLGVQIDNLCQFLPQDRVVEFAGMTPVELLRSTQRAVATQSMLDWHEQLKQLRRNQRELERMKTMQDDELANLESQHRRQEADVQRIREREDVLKEIGKLEGIKPLVEYEEKLATVKEAKKKADDVGAELRELESSVEPIMRQLNDKKEYREAVSGATEDRKREADRKVTALESSDTALKDVEAKMELHLERSDRFRKEIKEAQTQANQARKEVRDLKARIGQPNPVSQETLQAINDKIRSLQREEREVMSKSEDLRDSRSRIEQEIRVKDDEIRRREIRVRDLNSKEGQRIEKLAASNRETAQAWQWIKANRNLFKEEVYGPPLLECSVKDPRKVDMLESLVPFSELLMICVQNAEDFSLLQTKLREKNLSRVNQRLVRANLSKYRPPMSVEELRRFGLDDWAIDHIEGPDICLASLCDGARLHMTAIGAHELTEAQFEAAMDGQLSQWVTPKTSYKVTRRREYGPDATSTNTRDVRKARWWSDDKVDPSVIDQVKRQHAELMSERNELEIQIKEIDGNRRSLASRVNELRSARNDALEEQRKCQKLVRERDALPIKLEQAEEKMKQFADQTAKGTEDLRALDEEYDDLLMEKSDATLHYADAVEAARLAVEELHMAEIMLIEAVSDCQALGEQNQMITARLDAKKKEHAEVQREATTLRNEVKQIANRIRRQQSEIGEEVMNFFREVRARIKTLIDLDAELGSQQARLSLLQGDDGGRTLRLFEEREAKMEVLRRKTADCAVALEEVTGQVQSIRAKWEPRLEKLVARISKSFEYNMAQINCAGEVGIFKDENDFDQWAILIKVKFRENEPLSQLDSHRQSGGERAVSTIFYLMSLQSLTRSPFRVVDEINQGMDPRNERLVHARMVSIATGKDEMPVSQTRIPIRRRDETEEEEEDDENDEEEDGGANGHVKRNGGGGDDVVNGDGDEDDEEEGNEGEEGEEEEDAEVDSQGQPRRSGSQYFLITPKLLPDLRYERGMKVLCIGSGEHMPPPTTTTGAAKADSENRGGGVLNIDFARALAVRTAVLTATAAG